MENNSVKNFPLSKAMLASLWKLKESGRDNLYNHKYIKYLCLKKKKTTYRTCISRLLKNGLVEKQYNNIISLTEKGKEPASRCFVEAETALFRHSFEKWDGGWRIILFDIPEIKRKHRDYLRKILKRIGFYELQHSVWIYPYPVPPFLKEIILNNDLKEYVTFIATSNIQNDFRILKNFGLISFKK